MEHISNLHLITGFYTGLDQFTAAKLKQNCINTQKVSIQSINPRAS